MKLTADLRNFLEKANVHYSKQLGLSNQPRLLYNQKDLEFNVNATPKEIQYFMIHDLGRSWKDTNTIFLNVDNTDFLWQIMDTLVHELLHLKHGKLKHGLQFQRKINKIILDKTFL